MDEGNFANQTTSEKATSLLMIVAVVAVVASAGVLAFNYSTLKSVGYASVDTGVGTVNITSAINVRFNVATLDWGSGYVNGTTNAVLDSVNPPYYNENWSSSEAPTLTGGLEIENWGNVVVDLFLASDKNASAFICDDGLGGIDSTCNGQSPAFEWQMEDNMDHTDGTNPSCSDASLADTTWTDVNITGVGTLICDQFEYDVNNNELEIDLQLTVPVSSPPGQKTAQLTATVQEST